MSSPTRDLLRALVDDAAVFPPGNAPLPEAVTRHAEHRASPFGSAVGPLLVPAASASDLLAELDAGLWTGPDPLDVTPVARPGTDPAVLTGAVAVLLADPRVAVLGVELGWTEGWRRQATSAFARSCTRCAG